MRAITTITLLCVFLTACGRRNIPMPPDDAFKKTAPIVREIKPSEYDVLTAP